MATTLEHTYWNTPATSTFNIDTSSTPLCGVLVIAMNPSVGCTVTIGGVSAEDKGSGVFYLGNVTNNASLEVVVSGEDGFGRIYTCVFSNGNKFVACAITSGWYNIGEHCTATCAAENDGMAIGMGKSGWYILHTGFASGTESIHHSEYGNDGVVNWLGVHKVENTSATDESYTWAANTGGGGYPIAVVVATVSSYPPTITTVDPVSGTTAGGTSVIITGTYFTSASVVTIGGHNVASYSVDTATQITAVTASHAAEANLSVEVTTPTGTVTKTNAFEYTYVGGGNNIIFIGA
jgi:hypothetical protein